MQITTLRLSAAGVLTLSIGFAHAQAPTPPAFDFAKMRAEVDAFNKKPDTVGTGKYPAVKEMVDALPNHVIYRPADLSKLGKDKLGVLAWGNGGCAAAGAGGRFITSIARSRKCSRCDRRLKAVWPRGWKGRWIRSGTR